MLLTIISNQCLAFLCILATAYWFILFRQNNTLGWQKVKRTKSGRWQTQVDLIWSVSSVQRFLVCVIFISWWPSFWGVKFTLSKKKMETLSEASEDLICVAPSAVHGSAAVNGAIPVVILFTTWSLSVNQERLCLTLIFFLTSGSLQLRRLHSFIHDCGGCRICLHLSYMSETPN